MKELKTLTEKQLQSRLNKYYKKHYGESDADGFYPNPAPNKWKFERNGKIIVLVCDMLTGEVTKKQGIK